MSQHPLTPAQAERLAFLAEECAEVIQAVTKIQRHGFDSYNPDAPQKGDNRHQLEVELGDLTAAMGLCNDGGDVDAAHVRTHKLAKRAKMGRYFHHQQEILL
jgi:NTP pyrophosphatase (non-canonical NTP hydrolase)